MNTDLTFHRSGTGPAGRRAGRVPSLPLSAIHPPRQPAIPDEGRSATIYLPLMRLLFFLPVMYCFAADILPEDNSHDITYWQDIVQKIEVGMTRSEVTRLLPSKSMILISVTGGWDYEAYTYNLNDKMSLLIVYKRSNKAPSSEADVVSCPPRLYDRTVSPKKDR